MATSGGPDDESFLRLDAAFRSGDLEAVRDELGAPPDFPNVIAHRAIGSCLGYAIGVSPRAFVAELLDAGADPNGPSDDGFPPLIAALTELSPRPGQHVRDDTHELIALLLERGAAIDQRGFNDYTALHLAASYGDLTVVDLLLAHGADPDAVTRIDDHETPLEVAAAAGHEDVVARLQPLTTRLDWEGAVRDGDVRTVRRLIRFGHDIDRLDGYGQTALMRAAHAGQRELVELLITEGADLDHTAKYGLSALMLAVISGHQQVARSLVRAGADTTVEGTGAPGFGGKTAAELAEDRGDRRLAAFLRDQR